MSIWVNGSRVATAAADDDVVASAAAATVPKYPILL